MAGNRMVYCMRRITMKLTRYVAAAALCTVVVLASACDPANSSSSGKPDDASSSAPDDSGNSSSSGSSDDGQSVDAEVTLTKTGGIAGAKASVDVSKEGSWILDNGKDKPKTGNLDDKDSKKLFKLASDKDLAVTDRPGRPGNCNDAYHYQLEVGDVQMKTNSCGKPPNETFKKIVSLLNEATGI